MKTATLLSLAATAFGMVSATPRQAKVRDVEWNLSPWVEVNGQVDDSPSQAGVLCGYGGAPRVAGPSLADAQAAGGFIGEINAKTGSINAPAGINACTQVSCVKGVGASLCNNVSNKYGP